MLLPVGSCKIKNNLNTFLCQNGRSRALKDQYSIKTKYPQSKYMNFQCLKFVHDFLVSRELGQGHFSSSVIHSTHTACLTCLYQLYFKPAAILTGHAMVLASLCCSFHCNWGKTFIKGLSWALWGLRPCPWCYASSSVYGPFNPILSTSTAETSNSPAAPPGLSQCQASTALHDPFKTSTSVPPGWRLHYQVHPPALNGTWAASGT